MRGLLLGTGSHLSPLPDIPAVARTLADLGRFLPCDVLLDPAGPVEMGEAIASAAESADDVLLVYFVGHGLITRSGALHLATAVTDPRSNRIEHTAFPYATLRRYLLDSPARATAVILDCCFSGRAVDTLSGADEIADLAQVDGGFVLAAAGRDELALAPEGADRTAFSSALLDLLEHGDPEGPEDLTLGHLHRVLARTLPARGLPRPRARYQGSAGEIVLARNRAFAPRRPEAVPPVAHDPLVRPYKGLAAFDAEDARLFFGREAMTARLVEAVRRMTNDPRPLLVTGASGSGKSSLLRSGLVPALARGELGVPGSAGWPRRVIRPGDPVPAGSGPMVLVVDQFEEAFTAAAAGLVDELVSAREGVLVVLGVRADFLGRCAEIPGLRRSLQAPFVVGPMSRDELRAAIERPATAVGLALEPGLTELLLTELGTGAGRLPLLSHALLTTWERCSGGVLTVADYRATGGIAGALAATAEEVVTDVGADGARELMTGLVQLGDGTDDTRRRVAVTDLPAAPLEAFARQRLVTIDGTHAELAHEALIISWPRLRAWLDGDRTALLVRQRLQRDAAAWEGEDRDPALLYRGSRLDLIRSLGSAPPNAAAFVAAGVALEESAARAARRRGRRRDLAVAVLAVLFLASLTASAVAVDRQRAATGQRNLATARNLLNRSIALRRTDPLVSLRLGLAAEAIAPTRETRMSLVGGLVDNRFLGLVAPPRQSLNATSGDGLRWLTVGAAGADLWDLRDPRRPVHAGRLPLPVDTARHVELDRTGDLLFLQPAEGGGELWRITDPAHPVRTAGTGRADSAVFSPGGLLALGRDERPGEILDVGDPQRPRRRSPLPSGEVQAFADGDRVVVAAAGGLTLTGRPAARLNGRTVLTVSADGGAIVLTGGGRTALWRNGSALSLPTDKGAAAGAAFGPDGDTLWLMFEDKTVEEWNVAGPAAPVLTQRPSDLLPSDILQLVPGGLIASLNHTSGIAVWTPVPGRAPVALPGAELTFGPGGRTAVSGDRIYDLSVPGAPRAAGRLPGLATRAVFGPDGLTVLGESELGDRLRWSLTGPAPSRITPLAGVTGAPAVAGRLVAGRNDGKVVFLNGDAPEQVGEWAFDGDFFAFRPDGKILAVSRFVADGPGGAILLDVADPAAPKLLASLDQPLGPLAWSPGGSLLASPGEEGSVVLRDVSSPANPRILSRFDRGDPVTGLAFGAGAATGLMVAAARDLTGLWDVADPAAPVLLATWSGFSGAVSFAPDGRTLALGHSAGITLLHDLNPILTARTDPRAAACTAAARSLTEAEWKDVAPGVPYRDTCTS